MVWVEMGCRMVDMLVYRGDGVDDWYSPMELELFDRNIIGKFCQEFLAMS